MSASTGTIRRPMAGGSILGAIAIGVDTLFAVGALAWGAVNLTATKQVATPVAAPQYIDRGGRGEALKLGPMPYSPAQVTSPARIQTAPAKPFVGDSLVDKPVLGTKALPRTRLSIPREISNR